jgi:hypothetical protein
MGPASALEQSQKGDFIVVRGSEAQRRQHLLRDETDDETEAGQIIAS